MSLPQEKLTSYDSRARILIVNEHAFDGLIAVRVACRLGDVEVILPMTVNFAEV